LLEVFHVVFGEIDVSVYSAKPGVISTNSPHPFVSTERWLAHVIVNLNIELLKT
jgi:hypothetical protein